MTGFLRDVPRSLTVVIPSKSAANLVPCIRAIREAGETCRIIVVDDGLDLYELSDRPSEMDFELVQGKKPFCFSRNVNLGIRAAEHNSDIIVYNDDTLLKTPGGFRALQKCAEENPEYGIIAASCNNVGNTNQHQQKGGRLREESRMVCFVCVFIPSTTIDRVGLLDERFVDYGCDDDDFSLRIRNAGLKIGIFDEVFVDHGSLTSSYRGESNNGGKGGDFKPNLRRFIEKWGVDNRGCGYAQSPYKHLFPQHAAIKTSDEERVG